MKPIKKILIANRSEIVMRITSTCKAMGIKTVAIFTEEDKFSPYIYKTDEAYKLKKNGILGYLDQEEIINIAKKSGADAIHPGYGFLAESHIFAQKVIDAEIIWIGPNPNIIKLMGDKARAREKMIKTKIPIIPGYHLPTNSKKEEVEKIAKKIGLPIILKDPLGGGGKGMRKVSKIKDLFQEFKTVASEANRLTGSKSILVEKFIENSRHIEIQIAGDGKNFIHLYERECSIQRRNQKVIEETPCNFLEKKVLEKMYEKAINIAKSVNYNSIGTVEFITTDKEFYFLEMNTRLQVEHSVTEMTTGLDLVAMQIEIAQGKPIKANQTQIHQNGHAIECRIYSENTEKNFSPSIGKIKKLVIPDSPFSRIDHSLEEKEEITPFFDPMVAKVTTFGINRKKAIENMTSILEQINISGITTNIRFIISILNSREFISGKISTQLLGNNTYLKNLNKEAKNDSKEELEVALSIASIIDIIDKKETRNKQYKTKQSSWSNQKWQ